MGATMYDELLRKEAGLSPMKNQSDADLMRSLINCITNLRGGIHRQLKVVDRQDAVMRYAWFNLPRGLDGHIIERILYYRRQLAFVQVGDVAYSLPYALSSDGEGPGIDVYGRYQGIMLYPFNGTQSESQPVFNAVYHPLYDVQRPGYAAGPLDAVIVKDYTDDISQLALPRVSLNEPILDIMSDLIPFLHTALMNSTGVRGVRVHSQPEEEDVRNMSEQLYLAAVAGHPQVPIVSQFEFQDLTPGQIGHAEEYLLALQSLDNYRLSLMGIENGGLFRKKTHVLESEQDLNTTASKLSRKDGLALRRKACDIANSVFGWRMWVDEADVEEAVIDAGGDQATERNEGQAREPNEEGGLSE